MERNLTSAGRPSTQHDATVVERIGAPSGGNASATIVESKWAGGQPAEATVLEKQMARPPAKNKGMLIGIAAGLLLVILGVGVVFMGGDGTTGTGTGTDTTNTTTTTSGTTVQAGPPGYLLLSATPWGDIERIMAKDSNEVIQLTDEQMSTPTRIELDPGRYSVTVKGPNGTQTVDVSIASGKPTREVVETGTVNYDELQKEIQRKTPR